MEKNEKDYPHHRMYQDKLQRYLLFKPNKYELMRWIFSFLHRRKIKIIWLSEDDRKKLGVTGYAKINLLAIPEGVVLEELIPVLAHELGHWCHGIKNKERRKYYELAFLTNYYEAVNPDNIRDNEWSNKYIPEEKAWKFAERLIKFYYRKDR